MTYRAPTDDDLAEISNWPITKVRDAEQLLTFVSGLWWPDGDHFKSPCRLDGSERIVGLSTWGWSENERLISAMQDNSTFWGRFWHSSKRGGHYEFALPTEVEP